jgi:hypothetical protein
VSLSSTVDQSGFSGLQAVGPYALTDANGYDYTGQTNFAQLTSIDSITVTLTINDGDTATGDYDNGKLFLGLDGVNTGLALNDFANNQIVSQTLTQVSPAVQAQLIAALQDGKLVGSVIDTNTTPVAGDTIGFPRLVQTTLDIAAQGQGAVVPIPAAALLAPLGAGLAGFYSRRFRKAR